MSPERYRQVNQLFHDALEQAPEDRLDFLNQACGVDGPLRLEVERMLAAHEQAGSFLNAPAFEAIDHSLIQEQSGSLIGRVIGHYRILSKLGEGGMGEVLLAEDTKLERRVALKLLPREFTSDRDRTRRFEREARAASALNHPNIVTIHEIGKAKIESGELHFIAQEFIEGKTLRGRIKEGSMPLIEALDVAIQSAGALQVTHNAGIAHRDIKPENIMLRPDGFVKILDFGLAKLIEPGATRRDYGADKSTVAGAMFNETASGMILGTAAYMSPEQARGLKVDARSDIWSLGVVLYETLTGRPPFKGETTADVIVSILDREPPPIPQSAPGLERIVLKALAKNREERYQTVGELCAELKSLKQQLEFDAELRRISRRATANEPPGTRFPTEEQIARRTAWRIPGFSSGASTFLPRVLLMAAISILVSVIGFFAWQASRPESSNSPPSPPGRQITYWLTVQKMREGREYEDPFESAGWEVLGSGWKFRLNLVSSQPGHFYLLNESPASGGASNLSLLFPSPSINNGSARMEADQPIQTGWYLLSERKETEKLSLVWAAQPVNELEAVKGVFNPTDKGVISDQNQLQAIREFLNKHSQAEPEVKADKVNRRTEIKDRAESFIHLLELEHR